jgi:hypothetical protein
VPTSDCQWVADCQPAGIRRLPRQGSICQGFLIKCTQKAGYFSLILRIADFLTTFDNGTLIAPDWPLAQSDCGGQS